MSNNQSGDTTVLPIYEGLLQELDRDTRRTIIEQQGGASAEESSDTSTPRYVGRHG